MFPSIEVASVVNFSEASGRVAAGWFKTEGNPISLDYQIHPPTIDTLVNGMLPRATGLGILFSKFSSCASDRAKMWPFARVGIIKIMSRE